MKLVLKQGDIRNNIAPEGTDIRTIEMTGKGGSFYLWVGTNVLMNYGRCFGTKSGKKTLLKFANEIIRRIG